MTIPGGYQHSSFGAGQPPFDPAAGQTIGALRAQLSPPQRMTPQVQAEAQAAAKESGNVCVFCIGTHPLPNGPGCPRIASFELDGDGHVKAATFWPGKRWAKGRVNFVEDAFEPEGEQEAGDGEHPGPA